MIDIGVLRAISLARLQDARVLFAGQRYDGAGYICGYAVELSLKARICDTLNWTGYPETRSEFDGLASFKVHNLDTLLRLSGRETAIKHNHFADWSIVNQWNAEARYKAVGHVTEGDASAFLQATNTLLQQI